MRMSEAGFELVRSFEGYHEELPDGRCRAYLDTLAKPHVWTIGFGCTEGIKRARKPRQHCAAKWSGSKRPLLAS